MIVIVLFLLLIALAVIVSVMEKEIEELKISRNNTAIRLSSLLQELEVMIYNDGTLEFTNPNKDRL